MTAWPSMSSKELLKVLLKSGWFVKRQTGSHKVLVHRDTARTLVFAFHDGQDLGPRMVARIAKEAGIDLSDL